MMRETPPPVTDPPPSDAVLRELWMRFLEDRAIRLALKDKERRA